MIPRLVFKDISEKSIYLISRHFVTFLFSLIVLRSSMPSSASISRLAYWTYPTSTTSAWRPLCPPAASTTLRTESWPRSWPGAVLTSRLSTLSSSGSCPQGQSPATGSRSSAPSRPRSRARRQPNAFCVWTGSCYTDNL